MYVFLKFVHVLSMALWIGTIVTLLILNRRLARRNEPALMQVLSQEGGAISMRVIMPAMLITLVTGIGMVQVGRLGYTPTWIIWGLVGVVASFVAGGVLTGGTARKLGAQIARGEIDKAGIAAAQKRILFYVITNLLILTSIVWAMVAKPG